MRLKLWYAVILTAFSMLPLAGCSGGGAGATKLTEKGTEVTVGGKVDTKSAAKSTALVAETANNVYVYNAQDGAQLGFAAVASDGSFSNLTFTLPTAKTILVFKAIVSQGTFRSVVPIDLSNPPPAGTVSGSNPINIVISQDTTNVATTVSAFLGLTGLLGDTGRACKIDCVNGQNRLKSQITGGTDGHYRRTARHFDERLQEARRFDWRERTSETTH